MFVDAARAAHTFHSANVAFEQMCHGPRAKLENLYQRIVNGCFRTEISGLFIHRQIGDLVAVLASKQQALRCIRIKPFQMIRSPFNVVRTVKGAKT